MKDSMKSAVMSVSTVALNVSEVADLFTAIAAFTTIAFTAYKFFQTIKQNSNEKEESK